MDHNSHPAPEPIAPDSKQVPPLPAQHETANKPAEGVTGGWYKATVLRRFCAMLIDALLLIPLTAILAVTLPPLAILAAPLYFMILTWKNGETLGKKWLKIKVVSTNGAKLTLMQTFLREVIGKWLSGAVMNVGYLWALWDKDRQTWHDKIAGTYVVTKLPNNGKNSPLMIIIAIGAILLLPIIIAGIVASVVVLAINPLELTRQARDTQRLTDLANLQGIVNQAGTKSAAGVTFYCGSSPAPCMGKSTEPNWVKADLTGVPGGGNPLPVDPAKDPNLFYRYCSDGKDWEIDAAIESKKMAEKAMQDNGNSDSRYEIGSNLTLCP